MDKNTIVLNGKRYDATTGALIGTVASHQNKKPSTSHSAHTADTLRRTPHAAPKSLPKKAVSRPQPAHSAAVPHRKPQPSKTLMRNAVRKPAQQTSLQPIKKQYPANLQKSTILPKLSVQNIDGVRLNRAKKIHKSSHIGRFTPVGAAAPIKPHVKPLSVAKVPAITAHHSAPVVPAIEKPKTIFEEALAQAKSHEQPLHKVKRSRKHKKLIHSLAIMSSVLIIAGSVMYFNKSAVELQFASVKAGFQAQMPSYNPSGFKRQATESSHGRVAIHFTSPASQSNFTLSQEASDWDSQTLFDNVVAQNTSYQTLQSNGRTIYLYGDNAAWVDGGILYKIEGNAQLTSNDISNLASSM